MIIMITVFLDNRSNAKYFFFLNMQETFLFKSNFFYLKQLSNKVDKLFWLTGRIIGCFFE